MPHVATGLSLSETGRPFGLILAGGRATRLGGVAKPLQPVAGRPMVAHVLERLTPQCDGIGLSVRGDPAPWRPYGPVVPDPTTRSLGPLAGILAGLTRLERLRGPAWMLSVPGDTPFVPADLVAKLAAAAAGTGRAAIAATGERLHPAVALWPVSLRGPLEDALLGRREGGVLRFLERVGYRVVRWPAEPVDPFFNINTPADLAAADGLARLYGW